MPCNDLSFLVVEDNPFQRRSLVQLLTNLGAQAVHSAENGLDALRVIEACERPIDIVICDITMPGMDGLEFIRRWSESGDPASLILMSAIHPGLLASVANMALAYEVKLLGVAAKPVTAGKLAALIDQHRSRQLQARSDDQGFSCAEVTQAWAGDEFECWFEARIDLASGRANCMSAVPRWRHPGRGVLEPTTFMPSIRAQGLEDDLGWLMLRKSAAQCRHWQREGHGLTVSVNLSFASLADVDLAARIQRTLHKEGLDPRSMVLGVHEAALNGEGKVLENLARLRLMGFGLAIDAFGTGAMAVEQLALAAFTQLVIRSSFVVGAHCDGPARAGLAVALEAASQLRVESVATGVASRHEWDLLREWGCISAQGPFVAPPVAGEAVARWLALWRAGQLQRA
jgi:EAL domain-containing protein (putative c-di-GMP-specific phosphodiesterase class I)/CheY-like chemotaxis protein